MCVYIYVFIVVLVAQSCLTLCDPMDYRPSGSSVQGSLQARILPFSRGFSRPRDRIQILYTAGRLILGLIPWRREGLLTRIPVWRIPWTIWSVGSQSDTTEQLSHIYIIHILFVYIYNMYVFFFIFFSIVVYHRILNIVP